MPTRRINRQAAAIGTLLTLAFAPAAVQASGRTDLAHLHAGTDSKIPIGWVQFCADNPGECGAGARTRTVSLTDARWQELKSVNLHFNKAIEPVTDQDQFGVAEKWTYVTTGKGDCEDYVLEKRRELAKRGWPLSQLLITVVIDKTGGGHAVLTVVTDRGEYILDNQTDALLPWSRSELTFVKRQSPENPNVWLDLGRIKGRPDVITATVR